MNVRDRDAKPLAPPMGDLANLLERVTAATGADRELDAEICVALSGDPGAWVVNPSPHSVFAPVPGWWRTSDDASHEAPKLTASLDAALALVERRLPGWKVSLFIGHMTGAKDGSGARAELISPGRPKRVAPQNWSWPKSAACYHAKTPALAVLAALLRALVAQEAATVPPSEPASAGPCSPAPPIHQDEMNHD